MVKKAVKNKSNTKIAEPAKIGTHYTDQYRDMFTHRLTPISQLFLDTIQEDMIKWVRENEDILDVEEFLMLKGIPPSTYYNWVKKYPDLEKTNAEVVYLIGKRREWGIVKRKYEPGLTGRSLRMYNAKWLENDKLEAQLKKALDDLANANNQIIIPHQFYEDQDQCFIHSNCPAKNPKLHSNIIQTY